MLDKINLLKKITKNNYFDVKVFEPYNKLSIEFLKDFADEIKKNKESYKKPDLVYLIFWCNKKIKYILNKEKNSKVRLGRGLIFHICPSNVPTNFIYSFFFGLLSGNSNIIKIPSKNFPEKTIILSALNFLFKKKKFKKLKNSNSFIEYNNNQLDYTKNLSSICAARVIWGGDKTINEIRKIWIPERTIEITFPDRYSISIINLNKLKKSYLPLLTNKFFYDSYSMNQLACNSPHFIFWIGKKNINIQNSFWQELNKIVEKKFIFDDKHVVEKYSNLLENIINQKNFKSFKSFKNNVYILNPSNKLKDIENIRGVNGTFFQININNLKNLKKFITKKCQTVTYFGFNKSDLSFFLLNNNLFGIDRMVPIGKALEIDTVWDGYDVIQSLSRIILVE